ncbi:MAG TPA: response regulator transcription factor [Bryobacteraceae bacterium]|nr:response regulator transcription factor [Bryobacteraceae bacterium]
MHTLVVCDTEPIAMEGLRNLLESMRDFRIVAAENTLPEAMRAARDLVPSMFLVDKAFGIQPVMDCLKEVRQSGRPPAAVVWGVAMSEAESVRFLQAGCVGIVRKTAPLPTVVECLQTVASGSNWMEHEMSRGWDRAANGRCALTARELQVRELVERGMKNKEIAVALGIRTGTVKIHLKHIFEKTGIHGRYGLALSGLKEKGLLSQPALEAM